MANFFTYLSIGLLFAFCIYLVYDALHAPELPPAEDPDLPAYDQEQPS